MIGLGEVQLSPTYYHNSCRSHRSLRLPSHNIVTPACTTTFIFPSSTLQITLALVAPLLRLLLVIFDCLRKLMLVIISMEPKTVTMSLLCTVVALSAQSNEYSRTGVYGSTLLDQASFMECIPFLPAMPADAPQHFIRVLGMHVGLEVSYLSCHSRLICSSHCHQAEASYHKCWCLIPTVSKPS